MTLNPYDVLGVDLDADAAAIKSAYRAAVKHCHPDTAGSDRKRFDELASAYEILRDPERRRAFDATGATDEPVINVNGLLAQIFTAVMVDYDAGDLPPEIFDPIASVRTAAEETRELAAANIATALSKISDLKQLKAGFSRDDGGDNIFSGILQNRIDLTQAEIATHQMVAETAEQALVELQHYRFKFAGSDDKAAAIGQMRAQLLRLAAEQP